MTTSADSVSSVQHRQSDSGSYTRYDLQLLAIPFAFSFALTASIALSLPLELAMLGAALVGIAVIVDGMFVHPPGPDTGRPS